nr:proline-rich receptor-like protein kinase PERK9 [Aegilops tauschii subsp. strangulata]
MKHFNIPANSGSKKSITPKDKWIYLERARARGPPPPLATPLSVLASSSSHRTWLDLASTSFDAPVATTTALAPENSAPTPSPRRLADAARSPHRRLDLAGPRPHPRAPVPSPSAAPLAAPAASPPTARRRPELDAPPPSTDCLLFVTVAPDVAASSHHHLTDATSSPDRSPSPPLIPILLPNERHRPTPPDPHQRRDLAGSRADVLRRLSPPPRRSPPKTVPRPHRLVASRTLPGARAAAWTSPAPALILALPSPLPQRRPSPRLPRRPRRPVAVPRRPELDAPPPSTDCLLFVTVAPDVVASSRHHLADATSSPDRSPSPPLIPILLPNERYRPSPPDPLQRRVRNPPPSLLYRTPTTAPPCSAVAAPGLRPSRSPCAPPAPRVRPARRWQRPSAVCPAPATVLAGPCQPANAGRP